MITNFIFALSLLVQPAAAEDVLDLSQLHPVLSANRSHFCSITDEQKSDQILKYLKINEPPANITVVVQLFDPENKYISRYHLNIQSASNKPLRDRVSLKKETSDGVWITGPIYQTYPSLAAYVNRLLHCQTPQTQVNASEAKSDSASPSWLSETQKKLFNLVGR